MKPVPPSIDSVSFSCPHCGAHADQFWFELHAKGIDGHQPPFRFGASELAAFMAEKPRNDTVERKFRNIAARTENGDVFFLDFENDSPTSIYGAHPVVNVALSQVLQLR